jgi:hypothetical protein
MKSNLVHLRKFDLMRSMRSMRGGLFLMTERARSSRRAALEIFVLVAKLPRQFKRFKKKYKKICP